MNKWESVYEEDLPKMANLLIMLRRKSDGETLIEVNQEGLYINLYRSIVSALNNEHAVAKICYGQDILNDYLADGARDHWLDRVAEHANWREEPISCEHGGISCDDMFHTAQVVLENEECDDPKCAPCVHFAIMSQKCST